MNESSKLPRCSIQLASPKPGTKTIKIMQWNILADGLAQNGDFIKADPSILEWSYRMPLVISEVMEADADVVCMQEVNHFDELLTLLEPLGYHGHFLPKSCSPAERYNCPPDGLAIFYKKGRFSTPLDPPAQGQMYTDAAGLKQKTGYLYILLRDEETRREIKVVTTHLKAKEGAAEELVRIKQMQELLFTLFGGSNQSTEDAGAEGTPVVIVGDFNATPESQTCRELRSHPAGMTSIWDVRQSTSLLDESTSSPVDEPGSCGGGGGGLAGEFSTWKFRSKGESKRIIDHIWFTSGRSIKPLSRWRMVTEEEIGVNGLPCEAYPSDHIALCSVFQWILPTGSAL